jgi:hypothetical protein
MEVDPLNQASKQMTVDLTSASSQFPTDGKGGSQTSGPSATFPGTVSYFVEGFTVQVVTAGNTSLSIRAGDGSTQFVAIPITTAMVAGTFVPIGGLYGYEISGQSLTNGGLSARPAAAQGSGSLTLWFRRAG